MSILPASDPAPEDPHEDPEQFEAFCLRLDELKGQFAQFELSDEWDQKVLRKCFLSSK